MTDPVSSRDDWAVPAERAAGTVARLMRRLTGVPEALLDEVKSEQPRYTGMAWAMLGTGTLAMVGMAVLVVQISTLPWWAVAFLAAGWGLFIIGIDYSIVTYIDEKRALATAESIRDPSVEIPSHWSGGGRSRLLLRVLLAGVLGLAIGESLVIGAFDSQATRALDAKEVTRLQTLLCSTDTQLHGFRPEVNPAPNCADLLAADAGKRAGRTTGTTGQPPTTQSKSASGTTSTTQPPQSAGAVDTSAQTDRLKVVDERIKHFGDLAQCEQYPQSYTDAQKADLGCSGISGNGPARTEALRQQSVYQDEKNTLITQINNLEAQAAGALSTKVKADADATTAKAAADAAATKQQEDEAKQAYNSSNAQALASTKDTLEKQLADLQKGKRKHPYGLSERFDGTEQSVNPWIRWGLRLLFVIVDLTPVLLKLTLGVSTVDQMVAIRRREAIYPYLQELDRVEEAFGARRDVRDVMPPPDESVTGPHRLRNFIGGMRSRGQQFTQNAWANRPRRDHAETRTSSKASAQSGDGAEAESDPVPPADPPSNEQSSTRSSKVYAVEGRPYLLEAQIGAGNYAEVWFVKPATDNPLDTTYPIVIKRPNKDKESKSQLLAELDMYRKLSGTAGIPSRLFGDENGIVLRYYPRTSIDRWFFSSNSGSRAFSYNDVLAWTSGVVGTLADIWKVGFVHGDGKPGNIVLTGSSDQLTDSLQESHRQAPDQALIIDFGSCVSIATNLKSVSPGYVPPEVLAGGRDYPASPLCDIYSFLGATLYFLCSGGVNPWQDQVREMWEPEFKSPRDRRKKTDAFRKAWIRATRANAVTPIETLNPELPAPFVRLIETWMAPEPGRRLPLGQQGDGLYRLGNNWDIRAINDALHEQLRQLAADLRGGAAGAVMGHPLLGTLHPWAIPADTLPDFTLGRDAFWKDLG